jgi:hypothetical protein
VPSRHPLFVLGLLDLFTQPAKFLEQRLQILALSDPPPALRLKEISLRTRILRNFNPSTDDPISFVSIGEDTWFGRFQDAAEPVLLLVDGRGSAVPK